MKLSYDQNKKMLVFSYQDIKTGALSNLKFETTECDFKKVNDNNYTSSEIKMSLENYRSLVKGLNYQNKFINQSKENQIRVKVSGDIAEFQTISDTE